MATRVYHELQRAGWTYRMGLPGVLLPGRFALLLTQAWPRWGQPVSAEIVAGAQTAFPYPTMQAHMAPYTDAGPPLAAGMVMNDAIFPHVEWTSKAHWPPFGQGSAVADWAARHNLSAFYVAALIAQRGTEGKHAMPAVLRAQIPAFLAAIRGAVREAFQNA